MVAVQFSVVASPVGELLVVAGAQAVRMIHFLTSGEDPRRAVAAVLGTEVVVMPGETAAGQAARRWLAGYFAGRRPDPAAVAVAPAGTPYQQSVWRALARIPYGTVWTYGQLARAAGGSPRSVGGANGRNPIAILIPCHRVVAAGERLGGYGGGLERKRHLLALEGVALRGAVMG